MNSKEVTFPIYRKYVGIDTWFRIESDRNFTEIKRIGKNYLLNNIEAKQYPEMLLIQDMINLKDGRWEVCDESEFEELKELIQYQ